MSIPVSDVAIGFEYIAGDDQMRVVIGCSSECKVVYAYKGKSPTQKYSNRQKSSLDRFAKACSKKIGQLSSKQLQQIIQDCNGQNAIVPGETCCLAKKT